MATLAELKSLVAGDLDRSVEVVAAHLSNWINEELEDIQDQALWWFLLAWRDFSTSANQAYYDLPSDLGQTLVLYLVESGTYAPLNDADLAGLRAQYGDGTPASQPVAFAQDPSTGTPGRLLLAPTPDAEYSMSHHYRKRLTRLTADAHSNFLTLEHPALVEYGAAARGAFILGDRQLAADLAMLRGSEFAKLWRRHAAYTRKGPLQLVPRLNAGKSTSRIRG